MVAITPDTQETHDARKGDTPRFLITMDKGIGDAVAVGLNAVEHIVTLDPAASGTIDVLCNPVQAQLFAHDPRVNRVIATHSAFYPGPRVNEWLRGIVLDDESASLLRSLRERNYEAVLPAIVAPGLFYRLHTRIMYPNIPTLATHLLTLRKHPDLHVGIITRQMVNRYYGNDCPQATLPRHATLYLCPEHVQKARAILAHLASTGSLLSTRDATTMIRGRFIIVVAPDTASVVTRPPTPLLATSLAMVLRQSPRTLLVILPGYTNPQAPEQLLNALAPDFGERVTLLPAEPRLSLLETAALVDQADVFVTGDTGVMHLAAATKRLATDDDQAHLLRNIKNTVVLFGGTNPDFYGYPRRTVVVGRGRTEQSSLRPGFSKEAYNPKCRDLFDHIAPSQVADAITSMCIIGSNQRNF